jgi:hypothetical protein
MREPGGEQPGDPVREGACLSGARAGEDQQRPLAERDRLALRAVEIGEQSLDLVRAGLDRRTCSLRSPLLGGDLHFLSRLSHEPSIGSRPAAPKGWLAAR